VYYWIPGPAKCTDLMAVQAVRTDSCHRGCLSPPHRCTQQRL